MMYIDKEVIRRKRCPWKYLCVNRNKYEECKLYALDLTLEESDLYMAGRLILEESDCDHFETKFDARRKAEK